MTSEREAALARAQATLASVEQTLAAPRSTGAQHSLGHPDQSYEAWQERKREERMLEEARARCPGPPPASTGNILATMSNDEIAALLGRIAGEVRKELLTKNEALSDRVVSLEARVIRLEGNGHHEAANDP